MTRKIIPYGEFGERRFYHNLALERQNKESVHRLIKMAKDVAQRIIGENKDADDVHETP